MTAEEYERHVEWTAEYPGVGSLAGLRYLALGLTEEAGEVAGVVKKAWRGDVAPDRERVLGEVGDTLWYATRILAELGYTLEDCFVANCRKREARAAAGTLLATSRPVGHEDAEPQAEPGARCNCGAEMDSDDRSPRCERCEVVRSVGVGV